MNGVKRSVGIVSACVMLLLPNTPARTDASEYCPPPSAAYTPSQLEGASLDDPTSPVDPSQLETPSLQDSELPQTVVPVYFHIITNGLGTDVPQAVIDKQLEYMNFAFAGGGESAASPFGFSMGGTTRTENSRWYSMDYRSEAELEAKEALRVGDQRSLNIYIVRTPEGNSWATFPWDYKWSPKRDGVVLDRRSLPGGTSPAHNLGHIAVHEAGHWLGLLHTFHGWTEKTGKGGCDLGDQVADTPAEDSPALECSGLRDTCAAAGHDPVHNFMDYSADACTNQFTPGQVTRMKEQWNLYRSGIKQRGKSRTR